MVSTMPAEQVADLKGREVYDPSGQKIGKVEDFYYDEQTGQAEWLGVSSGLFGTKHLLVPVEGMQSSNDRVTVPYAKAVVQSTPDIDDDELTGDHEHELFEHYGLRYQQGQATGQTPPPQPQPEMPERDETTTRPESGQNWMTRSEEEIRIGKRDIESGVARLRKWVEKKPVEEQVTLRQETARIEREPIDRPAPDAQLGDQEVEMRLHREEPVVEKRTVAKERVGLEKEAQESTENVRTEVRQEHIEADGADEDMSQRNPRDLPGSDRP